MRFIVATELQATLKQARAGHAVRPSFLLVTPSRSLRLSLPLPASERAARLELVGYLAASHGAAKVVFSELSDDEARITAFGVARAGVAAATVPITCPPGAVTPIEWLPVSAVQADVLRVFPRRAIPSSPELRATLQSLFGAERRHPAMWEE